MTAKILLVDDDTTFCLMLKTWLTKRGFSVEEAFSCKEAVGKLKKSAYDVVLTDLRLPDEDGLQVLQEAKKLLPGVQVILMTGYADIPTAVQAMKLGAFDYVAKPVIPDEILNDLEALKRLWMYSAGEFTNEPDWWDGYIWPFDDEEEEASSAATTRMMSAPLKTRIEILDDVKLPGR